MAWLLITAMPVLHVHSHMLGMMHHSPVVSLPTAENTSTDTPNAHENSTYKCSLCHLTPRLFEQELNINSVHSPFTRPSFFKPNHFHSLISLFKPARAPPLPLFA